MSVTRSRLCPKGRDKTYIDKLFEILIETGKVILSLPILCDQCLLPLQKLLPRLLQLLSFGMFVIDTGDHQFVIICFTMFGMKLQKFFNGNEGEG